MPRWPSTGTTSTPTGPEFPGWEPGDRRQVPLESSTEMGSDTTSASRGPCLWDVFAWQRWRGRRLVPAFARTTRRLSPCERGHPRPPDSIQVHCSRSRISRTTMGCLLDREHAYRSTFPPKCWLGWPDRPSVTWCPRHKERSTWASYRPRPSPSIGDRPREDGRRGANPISVPPCWPS